MLRQRIIIILSIYLGLFSACLFFQPLSIYAAEPGNSATAVESPSRKIIAYYFHGARRCRTCLAIESQTRAAIQSNFQAELESGTLEWRIVDVDAQENKHFITDFQLYTRSVVLVEMIKDKQAGWKNLDKVWQLVSKEEQFKSYIRDEIKAYLKEAL